MATPFAIAVHGGVGTIDLQQMSDVLKSQIKVDLERSVQAGYDCLQKGESAVEAVVAAVKVLEDSPHFNAGRGSVLNHQEMVEMEASIMDGRQCSSGTIAGVRHIRNPIALAHDVMRQGSHLLLIGEGAEAFAFENGHIYTEQDYFYTEHRYLQLQRLKKQAQTRPLESCLSKMDDREDHQYGAVGAVALDKNGDLAAATSTGGVTNKQSGRVGSSALIGAGILAENGNVAISTTSTNEWFGRHMVAADIAARMRYLGEDVATACEQVLHTELNQANGGVIAINEKGHIHTTFNCAAMYRASMHSDGSVEVEISINK